MSPDPSIAPAGKLLVYIGLEEHLGWVRDGLGPRIDSVAIAPDADALLAYAGRVSAILDASMKLPLTGRLLDQLPNLETVVTATTGADHIDTDYLASRRIPLLTLKGQTGILRQVNAAAEHSWLLLMACARRLRPAIAHVLEGGWDRSMFPGVMLKGKTLGLIGCGRIGQWMARYARAFEMDVVGFDRHCEDWPEGIRQAELAEILAAADFVSIHVPLNEETTHLLGETEFGQMKPGAILINTSRGAIVDENALVAALESQRVAACGVDVLAAEPDIQQSPLWRFARENPQCVITPHIGGFSPDALAIVLKFSAGRIRQRLESDEA